MENNKLIVEFMGVKFDKGTLYNMGYDVFSNDNLYRSHELKYHKSWDWLMPVATEIIKSRDEQNADWDLTDLKYALCTTNIELVYKAVIEFINKKE